MLYGCIIAAIRDTLDPADIEGCGWACSSHYFSGGRESSMKGIIESLLVLGTIRTTKCGMTQVTRFVRCAILACIIAYPQGASAYDAPWDGGHQTTSPGGGSGGGPPGGGGQGGGGDPVNLKAGNFGWGEVDVHIPGLGHPLFVIRTYNSQDRYIGPFGYGWHFMPMMQCIEVVAGSGKQVVVKRGDGVRKIYEENSDASYTAEDGSNRHTLTKDQSGFHLTDYDLVTYNFNLDGILQNISDTNGNTVLFAYDGQDRVSSITDASGRQLTMTYGTNDRIVSIVDFSGRTLTYGYDEDNNLISFTDALNQQTLYTYDTDHLLLSVTDPGGTALIANNYDARNRVTSQSFLGENVSFTYNTAYTRVNNRSNFNFDIYLNETGNPTEVRDPSSSNYQMAFTAAGEAASLTDSQGVTQVAYDSLGRIRSLVEPDNSASLYAYLGDTKLVASMTDPLNRTTTYSYDSNHNLIGKTNALSETTLYQYYPNGELKKVTYPDGAVTDFTYSATGYLTLVKDTIGTDMFTASYAYDAVGNVTSITMADSNSVVYEYDSLNQLKRVTDSRFSPSRVVEYEYDGGGNRTVIRQDGQATTLQYINNMIRSITYPGAAQTIYTLNGNDQISQVTYSQGNIDYIHNNVERITKATHPDSSEFDFTWANDNLTQVTGPGTDLTLQYDTNRRLIGILDNSTSKTTYFSYAWRQRTQMANSGGYYRNYTYDGAGRLTGYTESGGGSDTFSPPLLKKQAPTLGDLATAANNNKNNWLIQLIESRGPGGAVSKNGVQYPDEKFWHNNFTANKRWYLSLMPGLGSNRLNLNVRTPMDIMR